MLPAWIVPVLMAVPCAWALWERRRRRAELGARIWLLERERESAARRAVEEERARVARELHDIVSHSVSVMVVQAGAARHGLDGEGGLDGEAEEALLAVERTGREAMTELRHLLGVLAPDPDGDDAFAPQPSLSQLGTLVDRIAFAGLPVDVTVTGEPRPLPTGIDATGYRVVQEALTNALKHGTAGARAEVRVSYGTRNLRLEILNTGPSPLTPSENPGNSGNVGGAGSSERSGNTGNAGNSGNAGHVGNSASSEGSGSRENSGNAGSSGNFGNAGNFGRNDGRVDTGARGGRVFRGGGADGKEGRGLVGLRQRVAVYGGDLDARRRLGGGYRVRARIPLERP